MKCSYATNISGCGQRPRRPLDNFGKIRRIAVRSLRIVGVHVTGTIDFRKDQLIFYLSGIQMTHPRDRRVVAAGSLRGCIHANQSVRLERLRSTQLQRCVALGIVFFLSGRISKQAFRYRNSLRRAPVELFLRRCSALQSRNASLTGLLKMLKIKYEKN